MARFAVKGCSPQWSPRFGAPEKTKGWKKAKWSSISKIKPSSRNVPPNKRVNPNGSRGVTRTISPHIERILGTEAAVAACTSGPTFGLLGPPSSVPPPSSISFISASPARFTPPARPRPAPAGRGGSIHPLTLQSADTPTLRWIAFIQCTRSVRHCPSVRA